MTTVIKCIHFFLNFYIYTNASIYIWSVKIKYDRQPDSIFIKDIEESSPGFDALHNSLQVIPFAFCHVVGSII